MSPEIDERTGLRANLQSQPFPTGPADSAALLRQLGEAAGSEAALIDGEREWTGPELALTTDHVAFALAARFAPGTHIGWNMPNSGELVIGFLATMRAGLVWVGLGRHLKASDRTDLCDRAEVGTVIDGADGWPFTNGSQEERELPAPNPDRIAALVATSGTTGPPKLVAHTERSLLWPGAVSLATEPAAAGDMTITPHSLCSLNLMILGPLTALARGGTAVVLPSTDARALGDAVTRHGATRLVVVPTVLHDLLSLDPPPDLSSLRTVLVGGAGSSPALRQRFRTEFGLDPTLSYGLSEAPTGVARTESGRDAAKPLPGVKIQVVDGAGASVAPGIEGEIVLSAATKGPWAQTWLGGAGYWRDPEATRALWQDGLLHTGDIGTLNEDGLRVAGRSGDVINRAGVSIHPRTLEGALTAVDGVSDAAVVGLPDDRLGQSIGAIIVADRSPADVLAEASASLGNGRSPDHVVIVAAVPRNAGGKIDRAAVAALFE